MDAQIVRIQPNHSPVCKVCAEHNGDCTGCWVYETAQWTMSIAGEAVEAAQGVAEEPIAQAA